MLSKCANARCPRQFRYLHQGKLFYLKSARHNDISSRVNFAGCIKGFDYAWLCAECASKFEVVLGAGQKMVVRPRYRISAVVAGVGMTIGLHLLSAATVVGDLSELVA